MLNIFLKIFSSTASITIFNYAVVFFAAKELDPQTFAYVGLIQYSLNIILRIGSLGIPYEILRYGAVDTYKLNGKLVLFAVGISILTGAGLLVFISGLYINITSSLILFTGIVCVFTILSSSFLRTLGSYVLSNIFEKVIILSCVCTYIVFLFYRTLDMAYTSVIFLIVTLVTLLFSLVALRSQCQLNSLYYLGASKNTKGNFRIQMYLADLMFLVSSSFDKIYINQALSLEQLALWLVYTQIFVPFQFGGRLLYQVFFPELSQNKFRFTIKKYLIFLSIATLGTIFLIYPVYYVFELAYGVKYNISLTSVTLMLCMGLSYLIGVPSGVYLAAKLDSKNIKYNNIASAIASILLMIAYSKFAGIHFPDILIVAITGYYMLKVIFTILIIFYDKRYNNYSK